MTDDPYVPSGAEIRGEAVGSQSVQSIEAAKNAAHASWILPVVAMLTLGRSDAENADSSVAGLFVAIGMLLVVTVLGSTSLGLGIYAIVRSRGTAGVRKPAMIGVIISAGMLVLFLGSLVHGFTHANQ